MKNFINEANESTQNLRAELQSLRQALMAAYSWTSEAKCKVYGHEEWVILFMNNPIQNHKC